MYKRQASSLFKRMTVPKAATRPKTLASFREKVKGFQSTVNKSRALKVKRLKREQIVGSKSEICLLYTSRCV